MRDPRVSVAVSTYGRATRLSRLIQGLETQTLPRDDFEVVIVDDASTDETPRVLADLAARSPLRITVLRTDRNRGPAAGRTVAWRAARGALGAVTDDDCVPTPGWLASGLRQMGDADRVVVGRTIPDPDQLAHRGPFSRTLEVEDATYFPTANTFYRRADLEAVGGFDETFPRPTGEDVDLAWRVCRLGRTPVFAADALVYHDVTASNFLDMIRFTMRWTGLPLVVRKHPEEARPLLHQGVFWKRSHPRVLLAAVGLGLALRHPAFLVATLPWVWFRLRVDPLAPGPRRRVLALPGAFVIDLLEVGVMARGSIAARTFVL